MRALSVDVSDPNARPYFFWDEDVSVAELRTALEPGGDEHTRLRLLGKLLREARDTDVWRFVTPSEVGAALPALGRRLGRRQRFWEFLIDGWRTDGLLKRIVDLVLERVPQTCGAKHLVGSIAIDPLEAIFINTVTTILSRAEERDLVDLLFLERHGLKIESALRPALEKDGGCTPAALAWVLAEVSIPDGIELPGGVSAAELRQFVADLVVRLRRAAFPA